MSPRGGMWAKVAVGVLVAAFGPMISARAASVTVDAKPGALAAAVARAKPGDTLVLAPGRHLGPVVLTKSLTLSGRPGAEIIGGGQGSVISVLAPATTIRGLTIRNSGTRPVDYDAGIYVEKGADGFVAEDDVLEGNLFGIVLHGANKAAIRRNRIDGRTDRYETERGNGIHMWNVADSEIAGNTISGGRDGILIEISHGNTLADNRMSNVRFAVHAMYANRIKVTGNVSVRNHLGYVLMYSNNIAVQGNVSDGDEEHGLMLHTSHHSVIEGNLIRGTAEKCVFVYTSAKNLIRGNRIENCTLGLHFTGGSENNNVHGNSFVNNQTQVKFTGTIVYEWSKDGRGNYWSDNSAFDLDGDGTADTAYRPNTLMDRMVWRYPLAKLLMSSPVMEALKVAQSHFPALMPGGVVDSHPLMTPPSFPLLDHRVGS